MSKTALVVTFDRIGRRQVAPLHLSVDLTPPLAATRLTDAIEAFIRKGKYLTSREWTVELVLCGPALDHGEGHIADGRLGTFTIAPKAAAR